MTPQFVSDRVDALSRRWIPATLRWTVALLWLSNVNWKVPPAFGERASRCRGLCKYVEDGSTHQVVPGAGWVFEHVIGPNLLAFGWVTIAMEALLAVLFMSGRAMRTACVLGVAQSAAILMSVANADGEWYWSYFLMIGLHLAVLMTAATAKPPTVPNMAAFSAGYGVIVIAAHLGAGFAGDENTSWSLFGNSKDLPDEIGKGLFAGSIALGLLLIGLGIGAWFISQRLAEAQQRIVGWLMVGAGSVALVVVGAPRLEGALGLRPAACCVAIALGLTLAVPGRRPSRADDLVAATPDASLS